MLYVTLLIMSLFLPNTINCKENVDLNADLNRPNFQYKATIPPIPSQSKQYLNIANYNIRCSHRDQGTPNNWDERKRYFFDAVYLEDEAKCLMQHMQQDLSDSLAQYIVGADQGMHYAPDKACTSCWFAQKEPFPVGQTTYFRLALKAGYDKEKGCLYGNFCYPYRMIITLKRHASLPNEKEWHELRQLLQILQGKVADDLGAEYTSYASFQDVYHRDKKLKAKGPAEPHFFLHFIFRFPDGKNIRDVTFHDPNPYDSFQLQRFNLIKECATKPAMNFIFKKMPDILTLQEVKLDQFKDLKEAMPLHAFVGFNAHDGVPAHEVQPNDFLQELLVIAYRHDHLDLLNSGARWLSATPQIPSKPEDASRRRIVMWAQFQEKQSGQIFFVFNCHYDHIGSTKIMVDAELQTIAEVAQDNMWFAAGERFYKDHNGQKLYKRYLKHCACSDVRDASIMGHYGEPGSWGGFEDDPYVCKPKNGDFECDTLDVIFTNMHNNVLLSYARHGAYDPQNDRLYEIDEHVKDSYRLASDHFMIGCYCLFGK